MKLLVTAAFAVCAATSAIADYNFNSNEQLYMRHEMNVCANAANVGLLVAEHTDSFYGPKTEKVFDKTFERDADKPHKARHFTRLSIKDYYVNQGFDDFIFRIKHRFSKTPDGTVTIRLFCYQYELDNRTR